MSADHDRLLAEIDDLLTPGEPDHDLAVSEDAMRWAPSEQAEHPDAPTFDLDEADDDAIGISALIRAGRQLHDPAICPLCAGFAGVGFLYSEAIRRQWLEARRRMLLQGSVTFTIDPNTASVEFLDALTGGWWTADRSGFWSFGPPNGTDLVLQRGAVLPESGPPSVETVMARACPQHRPPPPAGRFEVQQRPAAPRRTAGAGPSSQRGLDGRRRRSPRRRPPAPAEPARQPAPAAAGMDPAVGGGLFVLDRSDGVNRMIVVGESFAIFRPRTVAALLTVAAAQLGPTTE